MSRLFSRSVLLAAPFALAVAGCSGSSGGTAPSPSSSSAGTTATEAAGGVDPCLVGSWVSTGVSGKVSNDNGSVSFPVSGGDGAIAVIRADGTDVVNYAAMSPETGTGSDGAHYAISYAGMLTAQLSATDGSAVVKVADPSQATLTISRNGKTVARVHPPTQSTSTYTCATDKLTITAGGVTTSWAPAKS